MARVYKSVMVNGKQMKKWVEEYAVFEFDEDGKMTFPPYDYFDEEKYYKYFYVGTAERCDCPTVEPLKNRYINIDAFLNKKDGQIVLDANDYENRIFLRDKKGKTLFSSTNFDFSQNHSQSFKIEFDDKGHLTRFCENDIETLFEYEENSDNLSHIIYPNIETWFEYSDDVVIREKTISREAESEDNHEIMYEYNENGVLIHEKCEYEYSNENEYEKWYEYDENGNLIHYKYEHEDSTDEKWCEYDEDGKLIHSKNTGYGDWDEDWIEEWNDYDENGHLIHSKDEYVDTQKDTDTYYEYDEEGNRIHMKITYKNARYNNYDQWDEYDHEGHNIHSIVKHASGKDDLEVWREYDDDGHIITERWEGSFNDSCMSNRCEYSPKGNMIHRTYDNGKEEIWDDEGHQLYSKYVYDNGDSEEKKFNAKGVMLYYKKVRGQEIFEKKWDEQGRLCYRHENYNEKWCEYESGRDLIHCHGTYNGEKVEWIQNSDGKLFWFKNYNTLVESDSSGNITHFFNGEIDEWYEYEFYDDGSIKKKICYRGI